MSAATSGTTLAPPPDIAEFIIGRAFARPVGSSGLRSLLRSGRFRYPFRLFRRRGFHRAHVEIEQALALVALVLVLLAQLDDLLEDLHIEPFALGLREHFLLLLVQLGQFAIDVLDPLD